MRAPQPQPLPHSHVRSQAHSLPQVQGTAATVAQPHVFFSQRHSFRVFWLMFFAPVSRALCALSGRPTQRDASHYRSDARAPPLP